MRIKNACNFMTRALIVYADRIARIAQSSTDGVTIGNLWLTKGTIFCPWPSAAHL